MELTTGSSTHKLIAALAVLLVAALQLAQGTNAYESLPSEADAVITVIGLVAVIVILHFVVTVGVGPDDN